MVDATPAEVERWLPVLGYEGYYEVSDLARVRRTAPGRGVEVGRVLRAAETGYSRVGLSRDGQRRTHLVHLLVAGAFLGLPPEDCECNHKDGNKRNNRLSNLEWVTGVQNMQHAICTGLWTPRQGDEHPGSKLTAEQVSEIRRLRRQERQAVTAARFGVSRSSVSHIQAGKGWRDVGGSNAHRRKHPRGEVHMRCEQCGREGTKQFRVIPATLVEGFGEPFTVGPFVECRSRAMCERRRWQAMSPERQSYLREGDQ